MGKKRYGYDSRGKKLERNTTSKNPVIALINRGLDELTEHQQLKELARQISISQGFLINIYNEQSNMPILPLQSLCHQIGIVDGNEIIYIFASQPPPANRPVPKRKPKEEPATTEQSSNQ